jgi:hypothetical protein
VLTVSVHLLNSRIRPLSLLGGTLGPAWVDRQNDGRPRTTHLLVSASRSVTAGGEQMKASASTLVAAVAQHL